MDLYIPTPLLPDPYARNPLDTREIVINNQYILNTNVLATIVCDTFVNGIYIL